MAEKLLLGKVEDEAAIIKSLAEAHHQPRGYRLNEIKAHAVSLLSLVEAYRNTGREGPPNQESPADAL